MRLPPDGLDDWAQTGVGRRLDERRDAAQHLAIGKWNLNAGADFDIAIQFRRNQIIELLAHRHFQRHARDHRARKRQTGTIKKGNHRSHSPPRQGFRLRRGRCLRISLWLSAFSLD